jgi:hypothetical protein
LWFLRLCSSEEFLVAQMVSLIDLQKMKGYSSKFLLILTRSLWCLPFNFQNEDFKGYLAWSFSNPTFLMFLLSRFPFFSLFSSSFPIFVFPLLAFKGYVQGAGGPNHYPLYRPLSFRHRCLHIQGHAKMK